jgi:tetratricopeptide (TPR) repeat protein
LLGTTGTQEQALVLLKLAEDKIMEIKENGLLIPEAEKKLSEAQQVYNEAQYSLSEQLSKDAREIAVSTEDLAIQAMEVIDLVETEIALITDDFGNAQTLLDLAETAYAEGDYLTAIDYANEAYDITQEARGGFPFTYILIIIMILAVGGGYILVSRKNNDEKVEKPDSVQPIVDLVEEFKKRPHLRTDDKAILRYIQESGGAFITEVRERFDIPKSSAWRMVKRLEEEGLLSSTTVGRETYLQISGKEDE